MNKEENENRHQREPFLHSLQYSEPSAWDLGLGLGFKHGLELRNDLTRLFYRVRELKHGWL